MSCKPLPVGNKLLAYTWEENEKSRHNKSLRSVKPTINTHKPPETYHILLNRSKRNVGIMDELERIDKDNSMLLNKMQNIMNTSTSTSSSSSSSASYGGNTHSYTGATNPTLDMLHHPGVLNHSHTLNTKQRREMLQRIQHENNRILNSISTMKPTLNAKHEWEHHALQHETLKQQLKQKPLKPLPTYKPTKSRYHQANTHLLPKLSTPIQNGASDTVAHNSKQGVREDKKKGSHRSNDTSRVEEEKTLTFSPTSSSSSKGFSLNEQNTTGTTINTDSEDGGAGAQKPHHHHLYRQGINVDGIYVIVTVTLAAGDSGHDDDSSHPHMSLVFTAYNMLTAETQSVDVPFTILSKKVTSILSDSVLHELQSSGGGDYTHSGNMSGNENENQDQKMNETHEIDMESIMTQLVNRLRMHDGKQLCFELDDGQWLVSGQHLGSEDYTHIIQSPVGMSRIKMNKSGSDTVRHEDSEKKVDVNQEDKEYDDDEYTTEGDGGFESITVTQPAVRPANPTTTYGKTTGQNGEQEEQVAQHDDSYTEDYQDDGFQEQGATRAVATAASQEKPVSPSSLTTAGAAVSNTPTVAELLSHQSPSIVASREREKPEGEGDEYEDEFQQDDEEEDEGQGAVTNTHAPVTTASTVPVNAVAVSSSSKPSTATTPSSPLVTTPPSSTRTVKPSLSPTLHTPQSPTRSIAGKHTSSSPSFPPSSVTNTTISKPPKDEPQPRMNLVPSSQSSTHHTYSTSTSFQAVDPNADDATHMVPSYNGTSSPLLPATSIRTQKSSETQNNRNQLDIHSVKSSSSTQVSATGTRGSTAAEAAPSSLHTPILPTTNSSVRNSHTESDTSSIRSSSGSSAVNKSSIPQPKPTISVPASPTLPVSSSPINNRKDLLTRPSSHNTSLASLSPSKPSSSVTTPVFVTHTLSSRSNKDLTVKSSTPSNTAGGAPKIPINTNTRLTDSHHTSSTGVSPAHPHHKDLSNTATPSGATPTVLAVEVRSHNNPTHTHTNIIGIQNETKPTAVNGSDTPSYDDEHDFTVHDNNTEEPSKPIENHSSKDHSHTHTTLSRTTVTPPIYTSLPPTTLSSSSSSIQPVLHTINHDNQKECAGLKTEAEDEFTVVDEEF